MSRGQDRLDRPEALLAQAEAKQLMVLVRAALKLDRGDPRVPPRARGDSCAESGTRIASSGLPVLEPLVREAPLPDHLGDLKKTR